MFKSRTYSSRVNNVLLLCGMVSSFYYAALLIFVPIFYPGYNSMSTTVSELSAIGAPTRSLWVGLCILYPILVAIFGWGVWHMSAGNRTLLVSGVFLFFYGMFNIYWPPMHQRQVLAAGSGTLTDTLHLVYAGVTVILMLLAMGFGAASFGKWFRFYSVVTMLMLLLFGLLTGADAPKIQANQPTPYAGLWERINIGLFLVWVIVLAAMLMRIQKGRRA